MRIFYNFELAEETPLISINPNHEIILNEIRLFIYKKLLWLENEINKEEEKSDCFTVIYVPIKEGDKQGVQHVGYSKELTKKMFESLKMEDFIHLQMKLAGDSGLN